MLPTAGIVDDRAAPHSGSAVEIEESAAAGARAMLDDEVAVKKDVFDFREQGIVGVEVGPPRLDHGDFRVPVGLGCGTEEIRNCATEEIGRGDEIRIEDGDEFALRGLQSFSERASLVAFSVGAVQIMNRKAQSLEPFDAGASNFARFVGGVVKDLHVEQFTRIIE